MVSMFNNWGGLFFFFARSANDKIWYIAKRAWPHNKRLDYERVGVSDNIIMRPPPTCPPIECIAFYYSNCWLCVLWHKYQRSPEINTLHTLSGHTPHAVIYGQNLLAEVKSSFTFLGPRSELSPFCAGRRHRLRAARRAEQSLMSQTAAAVHTLLQQRAHRMFRNYYMQMRQLGAFAIEPTFLASRLCIIQSHTGQKCCP